MTDAVFQQDAYQTETDATITAVYGDWVITDKTVFYPRGGGQPGDTGTWRLPNGETVRVLDTRKGEGGQIRHQVENANDLAPGQSVAMKLDWDRRYRLMRMHTCLHLLSALIPCGVTGGDVGEDKSRLDFDIGDLVLDAEALTEGLQRLIAEDHPVSIETLTEAELDQQPELIKTMSVRPPRGVGDIRMIRVDGVDYQPCGGTHIRHTGEIGAMRVSDIRSKGARNKRVVITWGA